jgi:uncharacterized protein (DUF885 family)
MGEMGHAEAVAYMLAHSSLTEPTAVAEVTRYCSWPTQASSYLTGSLAIERVRERWSGGLKEFHDRIAVLGCMPTALHERGVLSGANGR